jgi:tetratricopeptide (TPR) repeat protein
LLQIPQKLILNGPKGSFMNKYTVAAFLVSFLVMTLIPFPLNSRALPDPIVMGDKYFHQMRYRDAISWYELANGLPEAQWKMARSYVCYADILPDEERKNYLLKAEICSRRCIELNEKDANGHTWLAATLGNIAVFEGSRAKVRMCNEIKKEIGRALELNPGDDIALSIQGTFYRVLGNINWIERKLAQAFLGRIPDGGYPESEISFEKAIRIAPLTMRHSFELGLLYLDWGKKEKAKQAFLKAQKCPVLIGSDKKRLIEIKQQLGEL